MMECANENRLIETDIPPYSLRKRIVVEPQQTKLP